MSHSRIPDPGHQQQKPFKRRCKFLFLQLMSLSAMLPAMDCYGQVQQEQSGQEVPAVTQQAPAVTPSSQNSQTRSFGAFAGFTDRQNADFTAGIQVEQVLNQAWSTGAVLEYTPNESGNNDAAQLFGLVHFRPAINRRMKVSGGAGVEFIESGKDGIMFRTSLGYDLFLEGPLTFTPTLGFNFGENAESFTLGANLHYAF